MEVKAGPTGAGAWGLVGAMQSAKAPIREIMGSSVRENALDNSDDSVPPCAFANFVTLPAIRGVLNLNGVRINFRFRAWHYGSAASLWEQGFAAIGHTLAVESELVSAVWQMKGLFGGVAAGLLQLVDGRVSFTTGAGEAFNVPVEEVKEVKWPKLQMGFGFEAAVSGQKYKITFMKPNGASDLDDSFWNRAIQVTRGVDSLRTLSKAKESKKSAQEWRAVLGG